MDSSFMNMLPLLQVQYVGVEEYFRADNTCQKKTVL